MEETSTFEIPVVRLDEDDVNVIVTQLRHACQEVGFFYLEGHGLSSEYLDRVLSQSQKLFALPVESKMALRDTSMSRGYTAMEEETLDLVNQKDRGDTKEGYNIGDEIAVEDPRYDPSRLAGPNVWPTLATGWTQQDCQTFRSVMEDYRNECSQIGFQLTRYLAQSLHLDSHYFDHAFQKDPLVTLRLLHYSSETSLPEKGIFACGAHSDYGMLTLLLTDHHPGLQIYHQPRSESPVWMDVPPRKGAFVVNLGDMLERWTNGLFRSTLHRVVTPKTQQEDRYSIPLFYEPHFDTVVTCLPTCSSPENPPKFPPTTSGKYLLEKYHQTHADFSPHDKPTTTTQ